MSGEEARFSGDVAESRERDEDLAGLVDGLGDLAGLVDGLGDLDGVVGAREDAFGVVTGVVRGDETAEALLLILSALVIFEGVRFAEERTAAFFVTVRGLVTVESVRGEDEPPSWAFMASQAFFRKTSESGLVIHGGGSHQARQPDQPCTARCFAWCSFFRGRRCFRSGGTCAGNWMATSGNRVATGCASNTPATRQSYSICRMPPA